MDAAAKKAADREALRHVIQQWNANRLDIFELSEPNEELEFHGVMRFYFQDSGQKVATKCIRVASDATSQAVIETLIEKFRPDMRMLSVPEYALYEIHENGDERRLGTEEKPLLVQLNWHKDDREGRFLLRRINDKTNASVTFQKMPANTFQEENTSFKRKLSKREKKMLKKQEKQNRIKNNENEENPAGVAGKLYTELPETSFTRSISNPEAVMRRRRQQKLEKKLQQFRSKDGGPDTGGTLKIYGEALCKDVPYKTLLLSIGDSAAQVVREMLAKYGLDREDPHVYCLVQVNTNIPESTNDSKEYHGGTNNREYILDDDECPLAILMNHPNSRGSIMFHVRRRPADYHPRKRKKKPQQAGKWGKDGLEGVDADGRYDDTYMPFFLELNPDGTDMMSATPQRHRLQLNVTEVGSERPVNGHQAMQSQSQCLTLHGPHVMPRHCVVAHTEGIVTVTPCSRDAETYVNNVRIYETTILQNGATVKFGRLHNFRFIDPNFEDRNRQRLAHEYSYDRQSREEPTSPSGVLNSTSGMPGGNSTQNYETTFDVDGNVETVSTSSLGNKDETRSQRSVCSSRDGNRLSNYERYPRGSDAILPAVLEFREETEEAFLHAIITDLDPNAVGLKLAPTYTLYLAARYRASTHYQPDLTPTERADRLTILLARVAAMIQNVIQERYSDSLSLAFWMANASELLHFLKSDRHVSAFSLDAQDILAEAVQMAFRNLVSCLQGELSAVMPSFMSERDDLQDEENGSVLQVLTNTMSLLRRCRVNAALTIQLFSQLFHFVNVWAFNCVVTSPSPASSVCFCSRAWGLRFKARLAQLEVWAERQGLELAADCHLARIIQAAHLLQAPKYTADDLATISSTCFKLNSLQLRALLTKYQPAPDEPRLSPELVENVVRVAENVADELARTDGREVQLTEEPLLQLPFLLPEDGYSCDVVRGVPQGLADFLAPLSHAALCRMTVQPTSSGLWTVYQMQEGHPGARSPSAMSNRSSGFQPAMQQQPEYQVIKLHKSNNGMGLSIVAAKGAGQDRLGIYIKSVVKGGAADIDGQLQAGDQLLKVDGQSLVGITQEKAAEYLVRTGPVVTLEVAKQGAIYHGLATLLSQPSPVMGRASSRPSSPLNCSGGNRLPTSISMGNIRPSYNERLPEWSNRPPPGVASSTLPRRPTSLGSNFRPNHRQYLSPFDTPSQYNCMNVDSWQNTLSPHTPSGNIGGIITPTFVVTPPEAETASNHTYLEVPANHNKCYNNPAPDEICECEKEALRSKQEATGLLKGNASNVEKSSPNSVNWKAEVIRRYRERLEQKQSQNVNPEEIKCHLTNGVHNIDKRENNVDICGSENGADSNSTCSTLEADWDSLSSSSHRINETRKPVSKDLERPQNEVCSVERGGPKVACCNNKDGKLTEEEKDTKIREVQEIVSSLESIPTTLDDAQVDRSSKYRVSFSSLDKVRENPLLKPFSSGVRWKEDFFSSMLNLDLAMLDENSCSSSCHSSLSLTQDVSPRDLIFGCGRVAALARHFSQLGESEACNVRRTKSEPDISPRTDKRRQDSDYTVVYSVGLKSVGFSVDQNSGGAPEVLDVDCNEDRVSLKDPSFDLEKVRLPEEIAGEDSRCISPSDHNSSGSEDSNSPWVQLRRLLQAESKRSEGSELNREDDLEELSDLKEEPVTNMWARMKKLVKGGSASGDDDCTSGQVSTSWMYKTDVKAKPEKSKPERKTKKKSTVSLDSSYLSFDVTANEPVIKNSVSENCLMSSVARDTQPSVFSRGERSRSEEALLQKKKPKRRVVFSCVQENSDGEKSPSIQRYSVTKPNFPENDSPSVRRYSVTKPVETRPKFPDAYIRTRTCQSVEDLPKKITENPVQRSLARQFVSMPHIMHPLYIGGHTHLIPIRANSDETICRHLHCTHLNSYYHPWPRRMSERDLPSRVLSEQNHNTSTLNGGRNILPPHAPIHSSKSVPSLNTGGHNDSPGMVNMGHGPMGPMSPISPIMGPGAGRPPHHEVFNPGYSRTSSTTSIPQGLRSRSSQNLADPRSPNGATLPPMGLGSRQMSNPSLQPPQQPPQSQHSPNGHSAGPDGERFYQNLSIYRNQDMHNGYPPQARGKLPSPQHPSGMPQPQQDRSPPHMQKNLQNMHNLRGSQSSLHRDRPASAYLPQNSPHTQIIPGMGGMQARSQSSRDMVQNAKLAEMQEEVRRRELRQQQGQQVQPLRPQMMSPLSPQQQQRLQGYPQAGPQVHPPPTAPKPGGGMPQRPPLPNDEVGFRDSPPPPPPPTSTHPLYKTSPAVDSRYSASSEGAPRGNFYQPNANNQGTLPGRHIQFNTATNPWDREEKEREQIRRREAARQWRDQQIAELSALPSRSPQQEEQLRALRMEREFQRRAEEAARHDDEEEDDQESPERNQGLLRLAQPTLTPQQQQHSPPQQQAQQSPPQNSQQHQQPPIQQVAQSRPYNQQNGIIGRTSVPPNEEKERQKRLDDMKRKQAEMEREREQQQAEERYREAQKQRREEEMRHHHQQQQRLSNQPPQSILNSPTKNHVQFNNSINSNNNNQQNNANRSGQYTSPLTGKHPAASHLRLENLVMNGPSTPQTPPQGYQHMNGYPNSPAAYNNNQNFHNEATSPTTPSGPQQRLDTLLHGSSPSDKTAFPPQPPERGSSYSIMMSQPNRQPPPSGPLSPSSSGGLQRSCLSTPGDQTTSSTKRVSFHDPGSSQPPPPPSTQPPPIREDPNHFINEAETMLASPKTPDGPGGIFVGSTPGVIGAQEVYRDPRQRRLAEQQQQQQKQQTSRVPEKLTFKEKMKMFAMETGEDGTPRDKVKISRAQRDIDTIASPAANNS